jgi:FkbM family methyltransferase
MRRTGSVPQMPRPPLARRASSLLRRGAVRALSAPLEGGEVELRLRAAMALAGRQTTHPWRFALNELLLRHGVRSYVAKRTGRRIVLRHPMSDAWVVHEVLERGAYAPPPEVAAAVRGLGRAPRVLDLGAHVGTTTLLLLETWPDASITAVEPNPHNARLLRRMIELNDLGDRVDLREVAVGVAPGEVRIAGFSILSHVERDEFETTDLWPFLRRIHGEPQAADVPRIDAFDVLADADVVKLDIEGAEWEILADPRLRDAAPRAIVLEFHWQSCPGDDAATEAARLLREAGFETGPPFDEHDGVGMLWAWRPAA